MSIRRTSTANFVFPALFLASLAVAPSAAAMMPKPSTARHRLLFNSLSAIQWNPLGVQSDLKVEYRYRLYDSDSILFRSSYIGASTIARLNPAFARLGGAVTIEPLAVLTLSATYEQRLYFGTARMLLSYKSIYDAYDEDTAKARSQADETYATNGTQLTLQADLKAKIGPIALLNQTRMMYFNINLEHGDTLFYVNELDTLMPNDAWVLVNDGHLFYVTKFGLVAGIRHTLVQPYYKSGQIDPLRGNPNGPNHRLGPMFAYTFKSNREHFQNPTLILIVNWWINNRYRNGDKVSSGVPYGVLAFQFFGDFWTH